MMYVCRGCVCVCAVCPWPFLMCRERFLSADNIMGESYVKTIRVVAAVWGAL